MAVRSSLCLLTLFSLPAPLISSGTAAADCGLVFGSGSFGVVVVGKRRRSQNGVAVKTSEAAKEADLIAPRRASKNRVCYYVRSYYMHVAVLRVHVAACLSTVVVQNSSAVERFFARDATHPEILTPHASTCIASQSASERSWLVACGLLLLLHASIPT